LKAGRGGKSDLTFGKHKLYSSSVPQYLQGYSHFFLHMDTTWTEVVVSAWSCAVRCCTCYDGVWNKIGVDCMGSIQTN